MPVFDLPSISSPDGPRPRTILAYGTAKGVPAPGRARPLGPAAASDAAGAAAPAVDDPQRRRLSAARRAAGLSLPRLLLRRWPGSLGRRDLLADRGRGLRGRLPRPGHRPVQPDGRHPRSGGRPADDPLGRRGLLALRPPAALGAGRAGGA